MSVWMIEPRDTLVLRDGRPIAGEAAQMTGIPLPYPQAIAGFLRTRSSVDDHGSFVIPNNVEEATYLQGLKNLSVRGPWLGLLDNKGEVQEHVVPAPGDAILFGDEQQKYYIRLGLREGKALVDGKKSNMPDLMEPIFLAEAVKDKPLPRPPLWKWSALETWLRQPQDRREAQDIDEFGVNFPLSTTRAGIRINSDSQVVEEGALFSTEHREFFAVPKDQKNVLSNNQKLCLLAASEAKGIQPGAVPFAGKRRSVFLREVDVQIPAPPQDLLEAIAEQGRARMILLTPGLFEEGWKPSRLLQPSGGVNITLKAAIVPRPQTVSGWDFAEKKPKPTHRLVPAGSVYFIELSGSVEEKKQWLEERWWQSVSDMEQAQNDGYGLAVFGIDQAIRG